MASRKRCVHTVGTRVRRNESLIVVMQIGSQKILTKNNTHETHFNSYSAWTYERGKY